MCCQMGIDMRAGMKCPGISELMKNPRAGKKC